MEQILFLQREDMTFIDVQQKINELLAKVETPIVGQELKIKRVLESRNGYLILLSTDDTRDIDYDNNVL